ncbi:membrane glycoprotein polyprotein [Madre de Dios virus]|uniref:Envelopment polyprotein n=1 Tax=Madre de Dios virus TaxID=1494663 RepID=A0A023VZX9_9VIRU|nr:membrane glycoprotein polyprotein [Madre de Dios virus]
MAFLLIYVVLAAAVASHPLSNHQIGDRCFAGGNLIRELNKTVNIGELCVRDDISMIKSTTAIQKSVGHLSTRTKFYRVYIVKEWAECNPIIDFAGNFIIMNIDENGHLVPKMHTCRASCDIRLNKDDAEIILSSQKTNHYEIIGTTSISGWFKNTINLPLEHTCEHITVNCGQKSLRFHACFRMHRGCTRFFKNTYMPSTMIETMCVNLELIIFTLYIFSAAVFAYVITKSYIAYILLPVFYPITYILGSIYSRFKQCKTCMLAAHPFTSCPKKCVCGSRFNCTEALRVHRLGKDCQGYKSLSKARQMCKSKSWSFIIAVFTGLILMEFITPISGERMYKLSELAEEFIEMKEEASALKKAINNLKLLNVLLSAIATLVVVMETYIFKSLFNLLYRSCSMCGLIHYKIGLRVNLLTTNRCGTCICGFNEQQSSGFEYEIFLKDMHKQRESCKYFPMLNHFRNVKILTVFLLLTMLTASASSECLQKPLKIKLEDLHECIGVNFLNRQCYNSQELYQSLKSKNLVSEVDKKYFDNKNLEDLFKRIEYAQDAHRMILLERILYSTECEMHTILTNGGAYNIPWRTYLKNHNLNLCGKHVHKMVCQCINTHTQCLSTGIDYQDEITKFYQADGDSYRADLSVILQTIATAFRGMTKVLIETYIEQDNSESMIKLLNTIKEKVPNNYQMLGILNFAIKIMSVNQTRGVRSARHTIISNDIPMSETFSNFEVSNIDVKQCTDPLTLKCFTKRGDAPHSNHLLCKEQNKYKVFEWPEIETVMKNNKLCLGDTHCNLKFAAIASDEVIKLLNCFSDTYKPNPGEMEVGAKKCNADKIGECITLENNPWPIVYCETKYYYSDAKEHAKDGNVNSYCLTNKCNEDRFPINPTWFKSCSWDRNVKETTTIKEFVHNDISAYRKSLESEISTDLLIHHYRPTKNLPHIMPAYKSLTIQGSETVDGLQNSFIEGEMPAISGLANGYHLKYKGIELFDIVIFIRKAVYKANYYKIYTTGPSVAINMEHNEQCTGSCPKKIPAKENWLTFSKEHTSSWGCEEYGCLAIDTGCLYGSCQDVIRPEVDVYKKASAEQSLIELCITSAHETFCNDLDILEPIIGDKISAAFQSTQVNQLPNIIAFKKGQIFTGAINDLGNTGSQCGSIQLINNTLLGEGNVKFDYICHAMKRKDVIVRRCYNDHFASCNLLQKRSDLVGTLNGKELQVSMSGRSMGSMKFKVELGDISYKLYTENADISISGECGGCINCAEAISCALEIDSSTEVLCKLECSCQPYIQNILIKPQVKKYSFKATCFEKRNSLEVTVCKKQHTIPLTIKSYNQKIDLSRLDESNYVREEDLTCNTWLCKVEKEGIGVMFSGLFAGFGKYWSIAIYALIALVIFLILIYILVPIFRLIRTFLIKNEVEYTTEQKMR